MIFFFLVVGPTGIEPVPTASETIVLSIGLRAHREKCGKSLVRR